MSLPPSVLEAWREIKHLYDPARDSPSVAKSACEIWRTRESHADRTGLSPSACWDWARDYHFTGN